jgi:adenylate cyclase
VVEAVAAEPTPQVVPLHPQAPDAQGLMEDAPRAESSAVAARIMRGLSVVMPVINLACAAITYVFVEYVVPLPGHAPPEQGKPLDILAAAVIVGISWLVSHVWGVRVCGPMLEWLERGGEPDESQRVYTVRLPLLEARHTLTVWAIAGVVYGALDVAAGGSPAAGALIAALVALGGLSASALSYLAAEWVMRPATALALRDDPPARPLLPGVATRIYLAWEFGTAVAVGGAVVVAIAYLCGADISPSRMAATVIFLGVIALTVGLLTLLAAIRSVVDPLRSMRRAMARVEAGETDVTLSVDDGGEVGLLQAGFNRMLTGLRERDRVRDLFGRHVGEEVARSALRRGLELGGEVREAAVLFVDLIGSTAFVDAHDPRETVETLNRFFGIVVEVVSVHGGWVNKFEGDAALCVFGAPTEHPHAAAAALSSARELRRRLGLELDGLDAAIGLSAGRVVAGNIGAAERYEYTVIGDAVNEAARLTELAKHDPDRLLASEEIVRRAGARELGRWQLGEQYMLRGRSRATRVAAPT